MSETDDAGPEVIGVRHGMFGASGSGDTSGYGRLVRTVALPGGSPRPYGGYFDAVVDRLAELLADDFDDAVQRVVVYRGQITLHVERDRLPTVAQLLRDDEELRDKVDNWIVRGAQHLVGQYGAEITTIITDTIERWDAEEASQRIELHVGRDLQFIRINGTVVGALAGLVIYTVAQIIF